MVLLVGIGLAYPGYDESLDNPISGVPRGTIAYDAFNGLGKWLSDSIEALALSLVCLIFFSIVIVLMAKHGARRATLWQLRWPFIAIGSFAALLAAVSGIEALGTALTSAAGRSGSIALEVVGWIVEAALAIIVLVWLVKAIYFAVVDVFRAADGHPLLGIWTTSAIVIVLPMLNGDPDVTQGVPHTLGVWLRWFGPLSVLLLNVIAWVRLSLRHHVIWFRDGPVGAATPSGEVRANPDVPGARVG